MYIHAYSHINRHTHTYTITCRHAYRPHGYTHSHTHTVCSGRENLGLGAFQGWDHMGLSLGESHRGHRELALTLLGFLRTLALCVRLCLLLARLALWSHLEGAAEPDVQPFRGSRVTCDWLFHYWALIPSALHLLRKRDVTEQPPRWGGTCC
jgi:hypothetical protein